MTDTESKRFNFGIRKLDSQAAKKIAADMLRDRLASCDVPRELFEGIVLWVVDGIPPGSFLRAVLQNDLFEAVHRADQNNLKNLDRVVRMLNVIPPLCWGSPDKVNRWMELKSGEADA